MPVSGIGVDAACVDEFTELKLRKKMTYIIYKIEGDKIVIEESGNATKDSFTKKFPKNECRYAVFDADTKIQFILWTPETASIKDKMVYSTSKDTFHKKLEGTQTVAISAHDFDDFDALYK